MTQLANLTVCPLQAGATQIVLGEGPSPCDWMFVGERPGEEEDKHSRPFYDFAPSGRVLTHLISLALSCERSKVFITNVEKFRPPGNRTPHRKEIDACLPHLLVEFEAVQPKVVVALGRASMETFTKGMKLGSHHGLGRQVEWHGFSFILVPWYHPAATLHNPGLTPTILEDAKQLLSRVEQAVRGLGKAAIGPHEKVAPVEIFLTKSQKDFSPASFM